MSQFVIVKGAGDLASGIAHRLFRSGFPVIMTELPQPTVIRRTVAFAQAVFAGRMEIEGVVAVRAEMAEAFTILAKGQIPVVVDPEGLAVKCFHPWAVIDAIIAKRNCGTSISDAPGVIGVGPGFSAGEDVDLVVETMRGHYLGKVIKKGAAIPNTGEPGEIGGHTKLRIVRAPCSGIFKGVASIADRVSDGDVLGYVEEVPVIATISGVLRGLIQDGLRVNHQMKIGDIDPRSVPEHCFSISDKARAIGGGVLEGLLHKMCEVKSSSVCGGKQSRRA